MADRSSSLAESGGRKENSEEQRRARPFAPEKMLSLPLLALELRMRRAEAVYQPEKVR